MLSPMRLEHVRKVDKAVNYDLTCNFHGRENPSFDGLAIRRGFKGATADILLGIDADGEIAIIVDVDSLELL